MTQALDLLIPEELSKALAERGILLTRLVASGGMSVVYEGVCRGQRVAVKVLNAASQVSRGIAQALVYEAELMQRLRHPDLLEVLEAGQINEDTYFIVMPYATGGTLRQRLSDLKARGDWMSEREALLIAHRVACALEHIHAQGIVHRDIKPSNILFMEPGASAKLADFGVATEIEESLRKRGHTLVLGTPEYAAPEQSQGHADVRSDLYALGIVLYEMLAGVPPFYGGSAREIAALHAAAPLPPLPRPVSSWTWAVIVRATAKSPLHRFQSAREMRLALERALVLSPVAHFKRSLLQRVRHVLLPIVGWVGAVALVGLIVLALGISALANRVETYLSDESTWVFPPTGVENRLSDSEAYYLTDHAVESVTGGLLRVSRLIFGPANNRVKLELSFLSVGSLEVVFWLVVRDGLPEVEIVSIGLGNFPVISGVLEEAINRGLTASWQRHGYRLSMLAIKPEGEMIYIVEGPVSPHAEHFQGTSE